MLDRLALSVSVTTTSRRRRLRNRLIERLGGMDTIRAETVAFDIVVDFAKNGSWPTSKEAWQRVHPSATHHLLLQDDVYPCDDFWVVLRAVIDAAPDRVITLFSFRTSAAGEAMARGHHFARSYGMSGQGLVMPARHVLKMLEWSEQWVPPEVRWSDYRPDLYCEFFDLEPLETVPSIVDHRDDGMSECGHQTNRNASTFDAAIGIKRSAWEVPPASGLAHGRGVIPMTKGCLAYLRNGESVPWPLPSSRVRKERGSDE